MTAPASPTQSYREELASTPIVDSDHPKVREFATLHAAGAGSDEERAIREGRQHMEYVNEHGEFMDVPLDAMRATFTEKYPFLELGGAGADGAFGEGADFDRDVEAETSEAG